MSGWVPDSPERDVIRVEFTLAEQDLRRALGEMPVVRRLVRLWIFGLALLPVGLWASYASSGTSMPMSKLEWLLPSLLFCVMLWYFLTIAPARRQHRAMKDTERTIRYEFTPDGFSMESEGASSHVSYSRVHRVVDARHSLLIFCNPHSAQVLPKRALSPADLETVERWLGDAVKPRRARIFRVPAVVLWILLIVVFLAVWQFLSPGP